MIMNRTLLALILFTFSFAPTPIFAQERWQLEWRVGLVNPINNFASVELETGANLSGSIAYEFLLKLSGFFGCGLNFFQRDNE